MQPDHRGGTTTGPSNHSANRLVAGHARVQFPPLAQVLRDEAKVFSGCRNNGMTRRLMSGCLAYCRQVASEIDDGVWAKYKWAYGGI